MSELVRRYCGGAPARERVSVIIGYFGDRNVWDPMVKRAAESVAGQSVAVELLVSYHDSLMEARNEAAWVATGDFLVFLDADDELDALYVERMLEIDGDLRQPATLGVYEDGTEDDEAVLIPQKPLLQGNYIVIGAMVRRELFLKVGGFDNLPVAEDWSLWLRCWIEGAQITACPEAVYRVHVRPHSRNQDGADLRDVFNDLRRQYTAEAMARGLA